MHIFEVSEISPNQFPLWDTLVDQSPHGTIFHKSGWLDVFAQSSGKKVKIFGCFGNEGLVGGCSLFVENSYNIVTSAKSTCAGTPYGGLVISPCPSKGVHKQESFLREIISAITDSISSEKLYHVNLKNSPEFHDIRPLTANGWSSRVFYTYYINLAGDIASRIDSDARYNCRKAERSGINIEISTDISQFYELLSRTYIRKNLKPPVSKKLISELYLYIKKNNCGEIAVAKTPEDQVIAAEINVWDKRMPYAWLAASDSQYHNTRATTLLALATFQRRQDQGFPQINIMMANKPELSQFASHLNPMLVPYYEVKKKIYRNILSLKNWRLLMVIPCLVIIFALNMLEGFECVGENLFSFSDFCFSSY